MPKREFKHLPVPLVMKGIPKLRGGGGPSEQTEKNKENRQQHVNVLSEQKQQLSAFWKDRLEERNKDNLPKIPKGIPILVKIDPEVDIDFLRSSFGFEIVGEQKEGYVIIACEDVELNKFEEKMNGFINKKYGTGTVARVYGLCVEGDRIRSILTDELYKKWGTLEDDKYYIVDVGIECLGTSYISELKDIDKFDHDEEKYINHVERWKEKRIKAYIEWDNLRIERETDLVNFVEEYRGEILNSIDGKTINAWLPDSFTVRIKISGKGLRDLTNNFPYIFEISLPDDIRSPFNENNLEVSQESRMEISVFVKIVVVKT